MNNKLHHSIKRIHHAAVAKHKAIRKDLRLPLDLVLILLPILIGLTIGLSIQWHLNQKTDQGRPYQGKVPLLFSQKTTFLPTESPIFTITIPTNSLEGVGLSRENVWQSKTESIKGNLIYAYRNTNVPVTIKKTTPGFFTVAVDKADFRPGQFHLTIQTKDGSQVIRNLNQDFRWGVVALNTDKSVYQTGDTAKLSFGMINNLGHTICQGNLTLTIQEPDGALVTLSTDNQKISRSGKCMGDSHVDVADYLANYNVTKEGRYWMHLVGKSNDGQHAIDDYFDVKNDEPFVIERTKFPSRIYFPEPYDVKFSVTANRDYTGMFTDTVPQDFGITNISGGGETRTANSITTPCLASDSQRDDCTNQAFAKVGRTDIVWNVHLTKGETKILTYTIKFPPKSPDFFLLGPARIGSSQEQRQWQIAADNACVAIASADWGNASTWNTCGGSFPGSTDSADLKTFTVTVSSNQLVLFVTSSGVGGTLSFTNSPQLEFLANDGTTLVSNITWTSNGNETLTVFTNTATPPDILHINATIHQFLFEGGPSSSLYHITDTSHNLTIGSGGSFTSSSNSGILDDNGRQINGPGSGSGTMTIQTGSKLQLGSSTTATTMPTFQTYSFDAACTVIYQAGVAQTVSHSPTYGNLSLASLSSSVTYTLDGAATIAGSVTISAISALDASSTNHYNLTVGGSWTNSGTFFNGSATITFNSTSTGNTITRGSSAFNNLTFNGVGGKWTFQDAQNNSTGTFTITNGTLDDGGHQINAQSGSLVISAGGQLNLGSAATATTWPTGFTAANTTINAASTVQYQAGVAQTIATKDSGGVNALPSYGNLTINALSGNPTFSLQGALTAQGNVTITAGTLTTTGSNFNMTVGGNWSNSGTFTANTDTVTFNAGATGKTVTSGGSAFYNATFNNASGGWTLQDNTTVSNVLTITAGNFSAGSVTLTLFGTGTPLSISGTFTSATSTVAYTGGTSAVTVSATTYYNLTLNHASTIFTLAGAITANNTITITAGTLDTSSGNNYAITVGGSWSNSGTFTARSTTVTFNGSATSYTIGGSNDSSFYNLTLNNATGKWTLGHAETVSNNLALSAGTVDDGGNQIAGNGTGTFTISAGTQLNLGSASTATAWPTNFTAGHTTVDAASTVQYQAGVAQTISSTPTYGNLTIAPLSGSPTFTLAGSFSVAGNWTNSGGTVSPGTTMVTFTAGATGKTITSGGSSFYDITFNNASGSWILQDALTASDNLTITAGTLDTKSGGNFGISVGNNWSNSGTFTAESGTVTFTGSGTHILAGTTIFNNFTDTAQDSQLTFTAGTTQTINGTLTLTGASGHKILIRSSATPTQSKIAANGTRSVSYVDVKDSNACSGSPIQALNSTDSGDNTCWLIYSGSSGSSSTKTFTSTGGFKVNGGLTIKSK